MSMPDRERARDRRGVARRHRAERFAEHDVGAAVQEADRLRVALDGHRRDASARRENSRNSMPIFSARAPPSALDEPLDESQASEVGGEVRSCALQIAVSGLSVAAG